MNKPDEDDISNAKALNAISINSIGTSVESTLAVTWETLKEHCKEDKQYQKLIEKIQNQSFAPSSTLEESDIKEFYNIRDRLTVIDSVVMYAYEGNEMRTLIPKKLRQLMIRNLHAAHQGATSILSRARQVMYWPGMDREVNIHSETCSDCREAAPSKVKEPLIPAEIPEYPFQNVVADLFEINGYFYLAYVDRLTGFAELAYYSSAPNSTRIISTMREFFHRWGVAEEASLDGGPNLDSHEIKEWLRSWGTRIRRSSAYYAQSNGRAEAGVKSLKRLLMGNTGSKGSINNDAVASALLQYRNTPLREINKSPAQLALGRQLRDTIPLPKQRYKVSPHWAQYLREREKSMSQTNEISKERYDQHSRTLEQLDIGDKVRCQNTRSKKWDRTGIVLEYNGHRQYNIKIDGSCRPSIRNRRHLWKIVEPTPNVVEYTANKDDSHSHTSPKGAIEDHDTGTTPSIPPLPTTQVPPSPSPKPPPPTEHYVRRSQRLTKKPLRYHEEFNSS